jgi:hypothetical protein
VRCIALASVLLTLSPAALADEPPVASPGASGANTSAATERQPAKPSLVVATESRAYRKAVAAGSIAAIHVAYATWSYFAWYRGADTEAFHVEREPVFDAGTYAGGADKVGHFWSNYALTRLTTAVLVAGGWSKLPSSLVACGLTELAFTLTEVQDGYVYGFDISDMIANVGGAALGVLMDNLPEVDRLLDFRVEYIPSRDYRTRFRKTGSVDIAQDYSGQSYMVALHLGALPYLQHDEYTYWARFVDIAVGFEARHYAPVPEVREHMPRQTLYLGLTLNMQGVLNELFNDSRGRRIGRGIAEVYSLPYTTFRYAEASRSPM